MSKMYLNINKSLNILQVITCHNGHFDSLNSFRRGCQLSFHLRSKNSSFEQEIMVISEAFYYLYKKNSLAYLLKSQVVVMFTPLGVCLLMEVKMYTFCSFQLFVNSIYLSGGFSEKKYSQIKKLHI